MQRLIRRFLLDFAGPFRPSTRFDVFSLPSKLAELQLRGTWMQRLIRRFLLDFAGPFRPSTRFDVFSLPSKLAELLFAVIFI